MAIYEVDISVDKCKGCSLCVVTCPKKIIELANNININGYRYATVTKMENCIGCLGCALVCPDGVIEIYQ